MNISILDAGTLGNDLSLERFKKIGNVKVYKTTTPEMVCDRINDANVIVVNKIKLGRENLSFAKDLKLICITATGYDNVDIQYCKQNGIAVCNVVGYSTDCVSQVTIAMVLSLANNLTYFNKYVHDGSYTKGSMQNKVEPAFHELRGLTWGIVGYGNIGKQVASVAKAIGCKVIAFKRTPEDGVDCVSLDELMKTSDIITIHLPLSEETKNIISKEEIAKMKDTAIIVNVARGAVWDEEAIADAIINKKILAMGCDVYSIEPMQKNHPFQKILNFDNVCLTPHMAWGAYETRDRCIEEICKNIDAFYKGQIRNRVV